MPSIYPVRNYSVERRELSFQTRLLNCVPMGVVQVRQQGLPQRGVSGVTNALAGNGGGGSVDCGRDTEGVEFRFLVIWQQKFVTIDKQKILRFVPAVSRNTRNYVMSGGTRLMITCRESHSECESVDDTERTPQKMHSSLPKK